MISENTSLKLIAVITVVIVLIASFVVMFDKPTEEKKEEIEELVIIDDRISPFLSQGLTVEILRMRNRGLMEKMLTFGSSWKHPQNITGSAMSMGKSEIPARLKQREALRDLARFLNGTPCLRNAERIIK